MTRGGARNRSGPQPSEASGRSDQRGFTLTALPAEGYAGEVPDWPLIPAANATERAYWLAAWRTPQACAWSLAAERWRVGTVARWVRLSVRCDEPDANAALLGQLHRFADQVGMTTAGLAEMGWKVAPDELGAKAAEKADVPKRTSSRDRIKVVSTGGA